MMTLQQHMMQTIGRVIANPLINGMWHSGKPSCDGKGADKIRYTGQILPTGRLLVRYLDHKQGDDIYTYQEGAELVRISGIVGAITEKAVILEGAGNWFPLAKIEVLTGNLSKGDSVTLSVPAWLAEGHGEYLEPEEYRRKREEAQAKADAAAQQAERDRAALLAILQTVITESVPASHDHPYTAKKLILSIGARQATKRYQIAPETAESRAQYITPSDLLIPAYDHTGALQGIQQITESGFKLMRGTFKDGLLWIGGGLTTGETPNRLYIAEGWATGVAVHIRTRNPVILAFATSNLMSAGKWARDRYPDSEIIFAVDNDLESNIKVAGQTVNNPGKYYATKAATATNAAVITPPTAGDWNDWHTAQIQGEKKPDKQAA
ncbi:toprim domain-containing protein [Thiothrix subterranea]|uniref:Toprim domain-containing protein n=1 Tax=Thiothrix subterranea TaxID=2735563 RepID=A0AA51R3W2_9GAMM|nr:toprim domain-containing protein [Thiothrix subterranea]MDQ5769944.1 toprim domain-containing protein [Thiothrix subterranea]WML86031.1 toprim domain-containing protein [Thiothrix subterranea]